MSSITIHYRDWSVAIQDDDPHFSTFLSSYRESTGEVPTDLRFDEWNWLPTQWKNWMILRDYLSEWSPSLLNRCFGVVKYADVELIVHSMLDLEPGWECNTIIDERTQPEVRRRLYESIGSMIREKNPSWFKNLQCVKTPIMKVDVGKIDHLLQLVAHIVLNNESIRCEALMGIVWNARLRNTIEDSPLWKLVSWVDIDLIYSEALNKTASHYSVCDPDSWLSKVPLSMYTIRYLCRRSITITDGIHHPLTILVDYDRNNIDEYMYNLSLDAYITSEGVTPAMVGLRRIASDMGSFSSQVYLECYAVRIHTQLITEAIDILNGLYSDIITASNPIHTKYIRAIGIYLLLNIGRNAVKKIIDNVKISHTLKESLSCKNSSSNVLYEIFRLYQDDEAFPLHISMNKSKNPTYYMRQIVEAYNE